jgi:hypothetical protein
MEQSVAASKATNTSCRNVKGFDIAQAPLVKLALEKAVQSE